ncbi:MAG: SDR family oxidoreductase [Methylobacteriaceae bacterium]|nr:SDR family oxidoreductase [Methylobacteriaceae bacterium]
MFDGLKGKRVLVIGGSSGLGLATAQAFSAAGSQVTIAARAGERLDKAREQVGAGVTSRPLDITDEGAIERFFAEGEAWDHVVITASSTRPGPVRGLALADAYASMNSKFWGPYRIARVVKIAEGGSLTLVSGLLGRRPSASSVLQGAINAAVEALGRGLALELSPIRVNTVSPGLIRTPLHDRMPEDKRQAMYEQVAARLPVKRVGEAPDVANAVLFLAATPFATGSTVFVDGGGAIA